MESADRAPDGPPRVPEIKRRVHPRHVLDLAILAVLPLLALLGLAGPRVQRQAVTGSLLDVVVEHVTVTRASSDIAVKVVATNRSQHPLDTVRVRFPDTYLEAFTVTGAVPAAAAATRVDLTDLPPLASATVELSLHAERAGLRRGSITVLSGDADTLTISLRTLILP